MGWVTQEWREDTSNTRRVTRVNHRLVTSLTRRRFTSSERELSNRPSRSIIFAERLHGKSPHSLRFPDFYRGEDGKAAANGRPIDKSIVKWRE